MLSRDRNDWHSIGQCEQGEPDAALPPRGRTPDREFPLTPLRRRFAYFGAALSWYAADLQAPFSFTHTEVDKTFAGSFSPLHVASCDAA